MSDALKQVNQEGKRVAAPSRPPRKRTLMQRIERLDTQMRLERRRRNSQSKAPTGSVNASMETRKTQTPLNRSASPAREAGTAKASPHAVSKPRAAAPQAPASGSQFAADAGGIWGTVCKAVREYWEADGTLSPAYKLWSWLSTKNAETRRHLHHLRREQKALHFPESDQKPVQLVLFLGCQTPMLLNRFREKTWGRRRKSIHRFARMRAWFDRKKGHPAVFLAGACGLAALALFCSFYTLGTTVTYDGNVVAKVSSELAAKHATTNLERVTTRTLGSSYSIDDKLLTYSTQLMLRRDVVDGDTFEEELSADIGLVTYGYGLYVDGELIGATPYEGALEELLEQLKEGVTDENTTSCDFQENVEVKGEYLPTEKIMNLGYLAEMLYSTKTEEATYTVQKGDTWSEIANSHDMTSAELLNMNPGFNINKLSVGEVLTLSAAVPYLTLTVTERERYVEAVPYDIEYTDSANLYKGDTKVLSAGKNGSADVVANVTYVNGEETQRTVLSYVTLVNPVTEQQARGTKERPTWMPTGTFRWPCSGNVTSRFGYRNLSYSYASHYHEGIDIANRKGTAIYAADGGTVTYSGWMSGYGYLVIIDHGNGYKTYYGHNSSLIARVGQHVYKGQQIARMGSTGNSTGNHCHFGVYYHGVAKNPLNYLP
ncbi:MAG: peptidoglycan DD-metalloendopeptidase family protein [Oscillibacter sp.]|jgi:murein DD-endopeptidase MepM/ murein hydrolase activator NlpD|nr:peptidoglycan DD-metalloendopeptidase family protein [Oscillibacter sp.]